MDAYERFLNDLKNKLGLDLSGYKRKQMERRISSLMKYLELENSYEKLIKILLRDEDIYHSFLDRITINVSEFFRNPVQWEILRKKMMPYCYPQIKDFIFGVLAVPLVRNLIVWP